ncbi:arsenate reductase family protein [Niabella soli]|uniref:Arsenate reductase n=1 Tax=Niabella soli DSM 19437 TaxID=929713 RepID=W0F3F2_9BACT|nr:ArsC/Spx/MgsR family protein [Niabella soli]AHF16029.1 arsenate reductase [Niabella soli DSM 19437]
MKKIYYLSTCDTCKKIMKETGISAATGFELQDIKTQPVTASQLAAMKKKAGSYEALFSKRALLYKELGLKDKQLTEADYKAYILKEYTFLKRPVVLMSDAIFIGSEKKTIDALQQQFFID